jgi:hypothetical protein
MSSTPIPATSLLNHPRSAVVFLRPSLQLILSRVNLALFLDELASVLAGVEQEIQARMVVNA